MKCTLAFSIFNGGMELLSLLPDAFHVFFFKVMGSVGIGLVYFFLFHGGSRFIETVLVGSCGVY